MQPLWGRDELRLLGSFLLAVGTQPHTGRALLIREINRILNGWHKDPRRTWKGIPSCEKNSDGRGDRGVDGSVGKGVCCQDWDLLWEKRNSSCRLASDF